MAGRAPGWEQHPFDFAWWFYKTQVSGVQMVAPGIVRIADSPMGGQHVWDVPVKQWDSIAQKYMADREIRQGLPVQMSDGRVLVIPYRILDDEADMMVGRGMQPHPDRQALDLPVTDQQGKPVIDAGGRVFRFQNCPRDWFERQVIDHISRRTNQPEVVLQLPNQRLAVPFIFFDALCKDFMRRRGDFVAAGWWPELLMADYGQLKGPPPVQGRADALGHGVSVMTGQQPQPGQPQQAIHPMQEGEGLL